MMYTPVVNQITFTGIKMIIDGKIEKLYRASSAFIISFCLLILTAMLVLQKDNLVNNFGNQYLENYYNYLVSITVGQIILGWVSVKSLYKLNLNLLYLLTILSAYFFAIVLTPLRLIKVLNQK